jgi:phosphopantothenoylcysteine decarboxylase/phosphopantothenate--cysteine ligase
MGKLTNKQIVLGVTGSIAAYKSADLIRRLKETGALVRVIMTESATQFITPLTLQTLSEKPVHQHNIDSETEAQMSHIELARWADVIIIAPATANIIAKLAHGLADDLLSTVCLATNAKIIVAPAMNRQMWANPATQRNVAMLEEIDIQRFGPGEGDQACGEIGLGRMLEPVQLVDQLKEYFQPGVLSGQKVLITAGPTREDIDPVRFVSNRSSGKMGYALAQAAAENGADVTLISGPVAISVPSGVNCDFVQSAQQMREAVIQHIKNTDIFIGAAAVADYRPEQTATEKIKKTDKNLTISMVRNPDILAEVAAMAGGPFTVGFAAETTDLKQHAMAKLTHKKLDMIAANWVGRDSGGFEKDENALTVLWETGSIDLPMTDKNKLARELITIIAERFNAKHLPVNATTDQPSPQNK